MVALDDKREFALEEGVAVPHFTETIRFFGFRIHLFKPQFGQSLQIGNELHAEREHS